MKILIADDEILSRLTILKILNDLGIPNSDLLQAESGQQILDLLHTECIDIAFIDIRLPDFSGLSAIEQCLSFSENTSFYVLTGYSKFEYAKEAIHLGVKDFLLKPVTPDLLASILEKEERHTQAKKKLANYVYANQISHVLLGGTPSATEPALSCLPIYLTSYHPENINLTSFYRIELEYPMVHVVVFPIYNMTGIVFCTESSQYSAAVLPAIRRILKQVLVQKENADVSIFYPEAFLPLSDLPGIYSDLKNFSVLRIFQGSHRIFPYRPSYISSHSSLFDLATLFEKMYEHYVAASYSDMVSTTQLLKTRIHSFRLWEDSTYMMHVNDWLAVIFHQPPCHSENDFTKMLDTLCFSLLQEQEGKEFRIQDVLNYIHNHFSEDLSVNSLASEFHFSPNYLSTLFKKETGTKFIDYVTDLRMAKGKQLLVETSLQIKEIALQVGYLTASHFIRTFVKYEGVTPNEYRTSHSSVHN